MELRPSASVTVSLISLSRPLRSTEHLADSPQACFPFTVHANEVSGELPARLVLLSDTVTGPAAQFSVPPSVADLPQPEIVKRADGPAGMVAGSVIRTVAEVVLVCPILSVTVNEITLLRAVSAAVQPEPLQGNGEPLAVHSYPVIGAPSDERVLTRPPLPTILGHQHQARQPATALQRWMLLNAALPPHSVSLPSCWPSRRRWSPPDLE